MSTFYTITREFYGKPSAGYVVRRWGELFMAAFSSRGEALAYVSGKGGRVVS